MQNLNQLIKICILIFLLGIGEVFALNPTIINGDVMLCPNSQETLVTQTYDTYQWYKDGNAIPGATAQTHVIDYYNDVLSTFSVFVSLGDESAMSPTIFVDGWVFNPIVVSSYGQGYWGTGDGWEMCSNHELYFEVMMPYTTNVQWYKDGIPIEDATNVVYQVTETGVYTVSGAPEICPAYVQYSLPLPVLVHKPPKPVITQSYDTLFTSEYPGQWYFGLNILPGETGQFILPESAGNYRFNYTDSNGCSEMSDFYYFEWDPVSVAPNFVEEPPEVILAGNSLQIRNGEGYTYNIFSITGKLVIHGLVENNLNQDISLLKPGIYLIQLVRDDSLFSKKIVKQ